jgi:hypothetical protein
VYHTPVVPKIYQSISSGNVNKSPKIKLDQDFWKIWNPWTEKWNNLQ